MAMIACDGACKRNGKPDCLSGYGIAVHRKDDKPFTKSGTELCSTSQRGELQGMIAALEYGLELSAAVPQDIYIVTDSAYLRNGITQKWYRKWKRNGWCTNTGDAVKNQDLWIRIAELVDHYEEDKLAVYQVKGHINPLDEAKMTEAWDKFEAANDGVRPPFDVFHRMIVLNGVADLVATECVAIANQDYVSEPDPSFFDLYAQIED